MDMIIIIFGDLIVLAGLLITAKPDLIFGFMRANSGRLEFYILAISVRVMLGILLINQAATSNFPSVIVVVGWLALAAGIALALMGRRNFNRVMDWALGLFEPIGRLGGVLTIVVGAFLVLSFV